MARESKLAGYTNQELRELGAKGLHDLGLYASVNGAWNALYLKPNGRLCDEGAPKADNGDKPAKRSNGGKRKGCFPARASVVQCLNKYLNGITDSEDPGWIDNPTWNEYKKCREINGKDWETFIVAKAKGDQEIAAFNLWIESNDAADESENAAYQAQQKALDAAIALIEAAGGKVVW